jgi:RNA polymerase sigma-70 factor (ECF subfamily)
MGFSPVQNENESKALEQRLESGDGQALNEVLDLHRVRLRRMVQLRMDRRLQGRVDPSDVIQDAYFEAATRLEKYIVEKPIPFFLWLRFLVGERLITLHRHHLGTAKRNADREISLYYAPLPEASSAMLAAQLVGSLTAPSQVAQRAERRIQLQTALNSMEPIDREIIALRHFEQLSRAETAVALNIEESAAGKRHIRAMRRLKVLLDANGGDAEFWPGSP